MPETTHVNLPYLAAAQAKKHVTMNEALASKFGGSLGIAIGS